MGDEIFAKLSGHHYIKFLNHCTESNACSRLQSYCRVKFLYVLYCLILI